MIKTAAALGLAISSASLAQGVLLPIHKGFAAAQRHLERIVRESLRDPTSAQFKPMYICAYSPKLKMAVVKVNAKNAFGGYTGFRSGLVMEKEGVGTVVFSDTNSDDVNELQLQISTGQLAMSCLQKWAEAARAEGLSVP